MNPTCTGCNESIEVGSFYTDAHGRLWHWPCAHNMQNALQDLETATERKLDDLADEPLEASRGLFYMHLRVGRGKATLAVNVGAKECRVGVAFCSPKDQYVKRIGRAKALGQLQRWGVHKTRVNAKHYVFAFGIDAKEGNLRQQAVSSFQAWIRSEQTPIANPIPNWVGLPNQYASIRPLAQHVRDFASNEHPARHGAS